MGPTSRAGLHSSSTQILAWPMGTETLDLFFFPKSQIQKLSASRRPLPLPAPNLAPVVSCRPLPCSSRSLIPWSRPAAALLLPLTSPRPQRSHSSPCSPPDPAPPPPEESHEHDIQRRRLSPLCSLSKQPIHVAGSPPPGARDSGGRWLGLRR